MSNDISADLNIGLMVMFYHVFKIYHLLIDFAFDGFALHL